MKTLIIAEAGVNHNGDIALAKRMIDVAAEAGVDYVKFQTFKTEKCISKFAQKAEYQKNTTGADESQFDMVKKLELSYEQHYELIDYCNQKGVKFFSTAFDLESVDFLASLNLGVWKIPSGEITNFPLLKKIAGYNQHIIMSTGMSDISDIQDAIDVLTDCGTPIDKINLLHCNTEYPTPMEDVNLKSMEVLAEEFGVQVGFSDHTMGIEVPIAAVALGACIIEKHFTLDRLLEGPDQLASIEPDELKQMVLSIRNIEKAVGVKGKKVSNSEAKNKAIARKSIVATTTIKQGDTFTEGNLTVKRPGTGISPMKWESVIGQVAKRDFEQDELIEL